MNSQTALMLAVSYLLGAIPFGVYICRFWGGLDIRRHGSGNIGATNVFRVLGPVPGILVLLADILKGWFAVWLCRHAFGIQADWAVIGAAIIAIAGHNWSAFLKFKGGKGASTSLGVVFALDWRAALICFGVFVVVVALFRFVSLGSMLGTVAFPVTIWKLDGSIALLSFGLLVAILSVYKHRGNIKRLLTGTEPKFGRRAEVTASKGAS